jgi:hypothetical protein
MHVEGRGASHLVLRWKLTQVSNTRRSIQARCTIKMSNTNSVYTYWNCNSTYGECGETPVEREHTELHSVCSLEEYYSYFLRI